MRSMTGVRQASAAALLRALLVIAGLGLAIAACSSGPPPVDDRPYEQQVEAARAAKDASFRRDRESPLKVDQRAGFPGLTYFPIDPKYRVPSRLTEDHSGPPVVIELQTTTNQRERMRKVGTLRFALGAASYTLTAFADVDARVIDRLFVPFNDETNGAETYHGGRYLNLDRTSTGFYDLDFNRAYHPFCVYNADYDCPIPPRENRLAAAIRAGEKLDRPK